MLAQWIDTIVAGTVFESQHEWTDDNGNPWDFTGWDVVMQVRPTVNSSTVIIELSTTNGRIISPIEGILRFTIEGADTLDLAFETNDGGENYLPAPFSVLAIDPSGEVHYLIGGHMYYLANPTKL